MEYMFPGWFHLRPPECLFYGLYYFILANYHDNNGGAIFFFLSRSVSSYNLLPPEAEWMSRSTLIQPGWGGIRTGV